MSFANAKGMLETRIHRLDEHGYKCWQGPTTLV